MAYNFSLRDLSRYGPGGGVEAPNQPTGFQPSQVQWQGRTVPYSRILQGAQQFVPQNMRNQPLRQMFQNTQMPAGTPQLQWNGRSIPWERVMQGARMYLPQGMQDLTLDELLARGGQR